MLFPMVYWELNLLLVCIPKPSIFCRRLKNFVVLTAQLFCNEKKFFLNYFFLHNWTYFEQITQKELSSCMISEDDGSFSSKVTVFAKDSILRKISCLKLFWLKSHEWIDKFNQCWYRSIFRCATHFGECFIQVWYIDREMIEKHNFFKYKSCSSDFPPSNKKKFDWFESRQDGLR